MTTSTIVLIAVNVAVVVAIIAYVIAQYFKADEVAQWVYVFGTAVVSGLAYCAQALPGQYSVVKLLLVVALIVMLAMMGCLIRSWWAHGAYKVELALFIALALIFAYVADINAKLVNIFVPTDWLGTLVLLAPKLMCTLAIGICIFNFFFYRGEKEENRGRAIRHKVLAGVTAVVVLAVCVSLVNGQLAWNAKNVLVEDSTNESYASDGGEDEGDDGENGDSSSSIITPWDGVHFYNKDVQSDSTSRNDLHFGHNPFDKGESVGYYHENFSERRSVDPALLAATMLALDYSLGTDLIGETIYLGYEEKLDALERVDAATRVMSADYSIFENARNAVDETLDSMDVKLVKVKKLYDQLYMTSRTVDGIPSVILYESSFKSGWCLVYSKKVKAGSKTKMKVIFHIPCGYQWANAAGKIKVKARSYPSNPASVSYSSGKGSPGKASTKSRNSSGPSNNPSSPSNPGYNKESRKAPKKNTEPNDDPGPGSDTNNPKNPSRSTKDTTDSSTSMTHDEYKADVSHKNNVNQTQKTGNDDNTPSTTPSKPSKVDNDSGNSASKPTEKKDNTTTRDDPDRGKLDTPD